MYKLKIIDTADYYILALDRTYNYKMFQLQGYEPTENNSIAVESDSIFKKATILYNEMDIPIDVLNTDIQLNDDEFKSITNICGKNIPITKDLDYNILLNNFSKILELSKVQIFWTNYYNKLQNKPEIAFTDAVDENNLKTKIQGNADPIDHVGIDTSTINIFSQKVIDLRDGNVDQKTFTGTIIQPFSGSEYYSEPDLKKSDENLYITCMNSKNCTVTEQIQLLIPNTYAIYNTLYDISLIVTDEITDFNKVFTYNSYNKNIKFSEITKDFDDFNIVETFENINSESINKFKNFFHKKTFSSIDDFKKKIDIFKTLFDITNNNKPELVYGNIISEKDEVLNIICKMYEQNTNPDDKIKATTIFNTIENSMHRSSYIGNFSFRKRLSKYLIDIGLKRKRISDGIYYYGLVPKKLTDCNKVSINDIMRIREEDEKTFDIKLPEKSNKNITPDINITHEHLIDIREKDDIKFNL